MPQFLAQQPTHNLSNLPLTKKALFGMGKISQFNLYNLRKIGIALGKSATMTPELMPHAKKADKYVKVNAMDWSVSMQLGSTTMRITIAPGPLATES